MSLSHSGSMSDESLPMENVEFSVSLNDQKDNEAYQQKAAHVRQQSAGSSIGSEDALQEAPQTAAEMQQQQQQYWQRWQQYYAAYGYYPQQPQQYPASAGGYAPHQQPQTGHYSDHEQQQRNPSVANYPPYMYPPANQIPYPLQQEPPQQRTTGPVPNQRSPYSPWSVSYAQSAHPSAPSQPTSQPLPGYPQNHKRSSSTPGYRTSRNVEGGAEEYMALLPEYSGPMETSNYGAVPTNRSPKTAHRRTPSDPDQRRHVRSSSDSMFPSRNRPGAIPPQNPLRVSRKRLDTPPSSRPNSVSGHRRGSSFASSGGYSVSSMVSIVSDIRKSAFYSTATENKTGRVQLHFPFEAVHLVPRGTPGILYKIAVDNEVFENYHRVAEDSTFSWLDNEDGNIVETDLDYTSPECPAPAQKLSCRCNCTNCATCEEKSGQTLPPNYFLLSVPDTIYRNILDEICAANRTPCGFFFCGHHEDVSRPSIWIAVVVVVCLFSSMAYAAFVVQA